MEEKGQEGGQEAHTPGTAPSTTAHKRRGRRRRTKGSRTERSFGEESRVTGDGAICTLSATHYLVGGTLGVDTNVMASTPFKFDTGAGFNVIRRSALPPGWEAGIDKKENPPKLDDANVKPLKLG